MPPGWKRLIRRATGDPDLLLEEMPDAPALFRFYRRYLHTGHVRVQGGWTYEGRFYPDYLTMGGAIFGCLRTAQRYCQGEGLDIGAGCWPLPGSKPIDLAYGPASLALDDIPAGSVDYVFSSHTLEHITAWQEALKAWVTRIRPGGILFLYLPHPSCGLWRMGNPFMGDEHKWVPTLDLVRRAVQDERCAVIAEDAGPDAMQSFYLCARKAGE